MRMPNLKRFLQPLTGIEFGGRLAFGGGGKFSIDEYNARIHATAVAACAQTLLRGFGHAEFVAERRSRNGEWQRGELTEWEMIKERPNSMNTLDAILNESAVDTALHGTGFLELELGSNGRVGQLWQAPASKVSVRYASGGTAIDHYRVGGRPRRGSRRVAPEAMIRIQRGIEIGSPALGAAPLGSLGDVAGADKRLYRALNATLHNAGSATIYQPVAGEGDAIWQDDQLDAAIDTLRTKSTGDNYGRSIASQFRMEAVNVEKGAPYLLFREAAIMSETRIAAVLGVPPPVAGLQSGLRFGYQRNTIEGARRIMYENVLMPVGIEVAAGLTRHLLPALGVSVGEWRIVADWSGHPIADELRKERVEMMLKLLSANVATAEQVAEEAGIEYIVTGEMQ